MPITDLFFTPLTPDIDLSSFDCDDKDINEFLKEDALNYQKEKMANTYVFLNDNGDVKAFFSISNDCLNDAGREDKAANQIFNRFHRKTKIPNEKRIRSYPSIKIGRLGVSKDEHRTGLAYELMDFIKGYSIKDIKPACRLLLLDAYNKERQMKYYHANDFTCLDPDDEGEERRLMYYNLQRLDDFV